MAKSVLAAVREAVLADAIDDSPKGVETGALAPNGNTGPAGAGKGTGMSKEQTPAPGGTGDGSVSQADHAAAVSAAEAKGHEAGVNAERERLTAALGAEGVKGDAGRMSAALDLAAKSPAMSGADVAAFVTANVGASKEDTAADYEAGRVAAAGLAGPGNARPQGGQQKATINRNEIFAARRKLTKEG